MSKKKNILTLQKMNLENMTVYGYAKTQFSKYIKILWLFKRHQLFRTSKYFHEKKERNVFSLPTDSPLTEQRTL